jgi:thiamine pyrophosphokinase
MRVIIFANGEIKNYVYAKKYIKPQDFLIASDGGLKHMDKIDIIPNLIVGDLDSLQKEILVKYKKMGVEIQKFNPKKDLTDTEIAINYAITNKYSEIVIFGGLGGRLDHSLGNIQLLYKCLKNNVKATLINDFEVVILINDNIIINKDVGSVVSLIPFSDTVKGINTKGLEYELINGTLNCGETRGISNIIKNDVVEINIKEGVLTIIYPI